MDFITSSVIFRGIFRLTEFKYLDIRKDLDSLTIRESNFSDPVSDSLCFFNKVYSIVSIIYRDVTVVTL